MTNTVVDQVLKVKVCRSNLFRPTLDPLPATKVFFKFVDPIQRRTKQAGGGAEGTCPPKYFKGSKVSFCVIKNVVYMEANVAL